MKFLNYDSPFMQFMSRVRDFMILNLLWVICSIPIITIGVSTSAYYYCMMKIVRGTDSGMLSMFFHSFKENLKQGILIMLMLIAVVGFLGVDLWACSRLDGQMFDIIGMLLCVMIGFLTIIILYVFPVLAQFENTIKNIIKNAFLLGIRHIGKTVLLMIITLFPIAFILLMPYYFILSFPVWLLGGVSVIVFFNAKIFTKIFDEYIINE